MSGLNVDDIARVICGVVEYRDSAEGPIQDVYYDAAETLMLLIRQRGIAPEEPR